MEIRFPLVPACMLAATLSACAPQVVRYPTELAASGSSVGKHYVTTTTTSLRLDSGYERTIGGGTEFVDCGQIAQGRVLRPMAAVITVEGAHIHEAYLVLDHSTIVGFYLPVEKAFSPLFRRTALDVEETEARR